MLDDIGLGVSRSEANFLIERSRIGIFDQLPMFLNIRTSELLKSIDFRRAISIENFFKYD